MGPFLGSIPDHRLCETRLVKSGRLARLFDHGPHDPVGPLHSTTTCKDVSAPSKAATSDAHCQVQANLFCELLLLACSCNCDFLPIVLLPRYELCLSFYLARPLIREHSTKNPGDLHLLCGIPRPCLLMRHPSLCVQWM